METKSVNIAVMLKSGQQILVGFDELSAPKMARKMREDIWGPNPNKSFCIQDYAEDKDPNAYMVVDTELIALVTIIEPKSQIDVPKKPRLYTGPGQQGA